MGFDDGRIILDSENGAYYAGQTVYGRVIFSQGKVKTIHGIYVDIKGFCKVHWTTSHTRRVNNRTEHYTVSHDSHEEYFRQKHYLFGAENGERQLKTGDHEFRFECPIPSNCPSTFEGSVGHIRYRIKVIMHTCGMFTMNKEKMVPIRVHAPLDLNQNPYCKEPMEFQLVNSYCCWCMNAGSSEIMVRMPVSGYCPGQIIPLEVTCKNESNVEIDELKFAIKKDVTYTAAYSPGTRYDHDTVAEIKKGPIPGRTTRNWTVEMEVPAMDIYNVLSCRYIDIEYRFKVSTEVSGCHEDNEETHALILGTIPIVGFQDQIQNPLHDQLPKPMEQGTNSYPAPPIINQPLPNSPYPSNGYPSNTPYLGGNPSFPTTPNLGGRTSPYPPGGQPFPTVTPMDPNQPFPNVTPMNPSYPGQNPGFPNTPYPPGSSPYPPGNSLYPAGNSSYPSSTHYPSDSNGFGNNPVPYPGGRQSPLPPYPNGADSTPLKTGTIGFVGEKGDPAEVPLLPQGATLPYPTTPATNPYAASAPEPSTPGSDENKTPLTTPEIPSNPSPYNPEFMEKNEKKDEKVEKN